MKLGIIGTGRIGASLAGVLAAHPAVTQLVLHDRDQARAHDAASRVQAAVARTVGELFGHKPDGIVITAATSAHAELIEAGADAGLPVFCEKPVAADITRTRQVLEHVTKAGALVQIGFQRRFDAGYSAARTALRGGELGELRRVHLITADPSPPSSAYISASGGIYRDLHIHDFDILRWTTGREVQEVYATGSGRGADYVRAFGDIDESALLLTLDDGTIATMQGSRCNGAGHDVRMELAGTRATYAVGLAERTPLHSAEPGATFPDAAPWMTFWERFLPAYTAEMHAFIKMVDGRHGSACTVAEALEALYIAQAADTSRREHRPVRVQETRGCSLA